VVGNIRHENTNFAGEVKLQNKMLDKVNEDIDQNTADMMKLDTKLKALLAKPSMCWYWMVLMLELVLGVIFLT
jgi:hypothetical protein